MLGSVGLQGSMEFQEEESESKVGDGLVKERRKMKVGNQREEAILHRTR